MAKIPEPIQEQLISRLQFIYKDQLTSEWYTRFFDLIARNMVDSGFNDTKWSHKDAVLITYGDSVIENETKSLAVLYQFLNKFIRNHFNCVHLLPFFPYTSDDGFSITDYERVRPDLGDWEDVRTINREYDLMMDLVINHVSQKHQWFQNFLQQQSPGRDYFIEVDPDTDLSQVVRPRSTPLLTPFSTSHGVKYVWTTFSADQVDLNFSNPEVLLEMLHVFFLYVRNGARIIRLDAIAFVWKQIGTSCLHLPETHEIVKLFRDIIDLTCPHVILLTETNVPNKENLSYFGDGDEANMIYQFSMPPLVLHALHTGNASYLTQWARSMPDPGKDATYFNFTASHDGIGVRPLEGLLPQEELDHLLEDMQKQGGMISTKKDANGNDSPYEINITYFDAMKGTSVGEDGFQLQRFICSQTIMMAFKGIPGFYIHSLLATPNDYEGYKKSGNKRAINRKQWDYDAIAALLEDPSSVTHQVFYELVRLLDIRKSIPAFHPDAYQEVLDPGTAFFGLYRSDDSHSKLFSISNITAESQMVDPSLLPFDKAYDLIAQNNVNIRTGLSLLPYQTVWLIPQ